MTTEPFLVKHGTKAFQLPPSAVVHTAAADLALRERKKAQAERPPEERDDTLVGRHYAFLGKHVRRAKSPADLIRLAAEDDKEWPYSTKVNVAILYSDKELLRAALTAAGESAA